MSSKARASLGVLALLLLVSICAQMRPRFQSDTSPRDCPLSELLPRAVWGWSSTDEPVADTEEMKRAVADMLNYDEAIVRTYRRGNDYISVYIAYWRPGHGHPRIVSLHTPDICWVAAGWRLIAKEESKWDVPGFPDTKAGRSRLFSARGANIHVLYWHVVAGKVLPDPSRFTVSFSDSFLQDLFCGQKEQYFVRLSSNRELKFWRDTELVQCLRRAVGSLGGIEDREQ